MLELLLTSSALILVVTALRFAFGGIIGRRLRYAMWGIVLLRLMIPVQLFQSPVSPVRMLENVPSGVMAVSGGTWTRPLPYIGGGAWERPLPYIGGETVADLPYNGAQQGMELDYDSSLTPTSTPASVLFIIWLAGAALAALWYAAVNLLFYRRLRRERRLIEIENCRLPVYAADGLSSPCLFGVFRPSIYLNPKALESGQATGHVLAHELIHHAHKDHIWSLVRGICIAVYWFNPLVWLAAFLSRIDCELACDEAAVIGIGEENRIAYGRTLVDMIARKSTPDMIFCAATTMASGTSGIKKRLNLIVQNKKTAIPALAAVFLLVFIAFWAAFTGAAVTEDYSAAGGAEPQDSAAQVQAAGDDSPGAAGNDQMLDDAIPQDSAGSAGSVQTPDDASTEAAPPEDAGWSRVYPPDDSVLTHGAGNPPPFMDQNPVLIPAIGMDGTEGYIYDGTCEHGHAPLSLYSRSMDEALVYNDWLDERHREILSSNKEAYVITTPLYAEDGVTVIGIFGICSLYLPATPFNSPNPELPQTPTQAQLINAQALQITFAGFKVIDVTEPVGSEFPLSVRADPAWLDINDVEITWTSSDTSVFEVVKDNPEGTSATVTIIGSGQANYATLTVAAGGFEATCVIRVR